MPTTRTRRARPSRLLPEHIEWAHSDEAVKFFAAPLAHGRYGDSIHKLPGVRPWWPYLGEAWLYEHRPAGHAPYGGEWGKAREFVLALHEEFQKGAKR